MSDKEIKVTDKRMFTPGGELREEYRFLEGNATAEAAEPGPEPAAARPEPPPETPLRPEPAPARPAPQTFPAGWDPPATGAVAGWPPAGGGSPLELPGTPPDIAPSFFDLAAVLAEPVAVYLGDVDYEGQSAENLEMARLHIDLIDVLRQKTAGNLTAQEAAFLEDLLYRLRVRYVQKRG
jgi:hypothetical protein